MGYMVRYKDQEKFELLDVDAQYAHDINSALTEKCPAKLRREYGLKNQARVLDALSAATGTDLSSLGAAYDYYPLDDPDDPLYEEYGEEYDSARAGEVLEKAVKHAPTVLLGLEALLRLPDALLAVAFKRKLDELSEIKSIFADVATALRQAVDKGAVEVYADLDPADI